MQEEVVGQTHISMCVLIFFLPPPPPLSLAFLSGSDVAYPYGQTKCCHHPRTVALARHLTALANPSHHPCRSVVPGTP
jgi:hypothetical protein